MHDREEPANIFPAGRQTKSIGKQLRKKFLFKGLMIMTLTDKKKGRQKPVVMLIVDTLLDPPLREAIKQNKAPAFQFLMERGMYFPDVVTAFPAMSVNVDTTLLTGTYCDRHHVPGLAWFSAEENRLINYGTGYRELYKLGVSRSLNDTLFQLNNRHISKHVQTIHEALQEQGKSSASINALIFRGPAEKKFRFPTWTNFFVPLAKKQPVKGTDLFTWGVPTNQPFKTQSIWKSSALTAITPSGIHLFAKNGLLRSLRLFICRNSIKGAQIRPHGCTGGGHGGPIRAKNFKCISVMGTGAGALHLDHDGRQWPGAYFRRPTTSFDRPKENICRPENHETEKRGPDRG